MSWLLIVALLVGTYLIRAAGLLVLKDRELPRPLTHALTFVPAALLSALIAVQAVTTDGQFDLDARVFGVLAALAAVVSRRRFAIVFVVGIGTTAVARWLLG